MNQKRLLMSLKLFCVALVSLYLLTACAAGQKTFGQMTPKERSAYAMALYNKQVDDYRAQLAGPLTDDQRATLKAKYEVFRVAWPVINAYDLMAQTGAPTPEAEAALVKIINQLAGVQ